MLRTRSKVSMVLTSSPARVDNLAAPPLSKLLRRRNSSLSSSSSAVRSSPLLLVRDVNLQEEREPSSPKVSCIGQVSISKRNPQSSKKNIFSEPSLKIKFKKLFFLNRRGQRSEAESQRLLNEEEGPIMAAPRPHPGFPREEEKAEISSFNVPPRNALLLMRCRSAPQRDDGGADGSTQGVGRSSSGENSRPLILTRCKSEPAWVLAKMSALEEHNTFWRAARASRLAAAVSS